MKHLGNILESVKNTKLAGVTAEAHRFGGPQFSTIIKENGIHAWNYRCRFPLSTSAKKGICFIRQSVCTSCAFRFRTDQLLVKVMQTLKKIIELYRIQCERLGRDNENNCSFS
jgi:hypothetical protein